MGRNKSQLLDKVPFCNLSDTDYINMRLKPIIPILATIAMLLLGVHILNQEVQLQTPENFTGDIINSPEPTKTSLNTHNHYQFMHEIGDVKYITSYFRQNLLLAQNKHTYPINIISVKKP